MVTEYVSNPSHRGLAPVTPGWFIVNTADAAWTNNESYGGVCIFESDHVVLQGRPDLTAYEKPHAGFTIRVVPPGQPSGGYHAESVQEDFLARWASACSSSKTRNGTCGMGLRALPTHDRARVRREEPGHA